jgi:hypothetical protein
MIKKEKKKRRDEREKERLPGKRYVRASQTRNDPTKRIYNRFKELTMDT